jgi:rod shape-determining protein MreD
MRVTEAIIIVLLFALLQVAVSPRLAIGEIGPDFPLLLVAYFSVRRPAQRSAVAGFLIGLFQDLFNPSLLGLNALTKTLTGYGLSLASAKLEPGSWVLLAPLFGVTALAHDIIYLLFFTGLDLRQFFVLLGTVAIPSAVYTAAVGGLVSKLAEAVSTKVVSSFGKARS